ncbi:MAG: nuclear transport factor 2 family protein [Asticcacaulis sp.]
MPVSDTEYQDLLSEIRHLKDEKAIEGLLALYARTVDYGRPEDYPALFTEDGAFELQGAARNRLKPDEPFPYDEDALLNRGGRRVERGFRFEGHAGLLKFISSVNTQRLVLHAVLQPVIRLEGDDARVQSQLIAVGKEHGAPRQLLVFGRYHDHVVRNPDGQWRFKERICEV